MEPQNVRRPAPDRRWRATRAAGALLALAGLTFIAATTLTPTQPSTEPIPVWCLVCGRQGGADVLQNLLLFVPYGAGLWLAGVPWRRALAALALTTFAVEVLQLRVVTGRDASLSDLLTNGVGGVVGYLLARGWRVWVLPGPAPARRLAAGAAVGWLLLLALSAWAVRVSVPQGTIYWGQLRPDLAGFARFPGRVLAAHLNGDPLPSGVIPNSYRAAHVINAHRGRLEVVARTAEPTPRMAPIVSVFDMYETDVVLLGQRGRDLVFHVRQTASDLRLRNPGLRLVEVFPRRGAPPQTIHAVGEVRGTRIRVVYEGGGQRVVRELVLSPFLFWSLLIPWGYQLGPEVPVLSALWIGGLLVPIAYWAARGDTAPGRRRGLAAALAVAALGVGAIPLLSGYEPARFWAWGAALAGVLAGWWLGRRTGRADRAGPTRARKAAPTDVGAARWTAELGATPLPR